MIHAALNVVQPRLTKSVTVVEGDAGRWARSLSTACLITEDGMAMRRPVQMTPEWPTTTGNTNSLYKRFGLADLEIAAGTTLSVAGGFVAIDNALVGDTFIERTTASRQRVYTQTDWTENQGFFLECWVPPGKRNEEIAVEFAWGEHSTTGTVGVRLYVSGEIEVYKWLGSTPILTLLQRYDAKGEGRSATLSNASGQRISLFLLPCSRRDLYIGTSLGSAIRHTFTDLSPDVVGTITPSGRAWWYVPTGKESVSLSELRYGVGTNNLYTEQDYLREAPSGVTTWSSTVYWDRPYSGDTSTAANATVVDPDNPTTIYPSISGPDRARILVQLSGTLRTTPFVYAAYSRLSPTTANIPANMTVLSGNTSDGVIDTTDDRLLSFDMSVGEQPGDVKATLTIKDTDDDPLLQQSGHSVRLLASQVENPTTFTQWRNLFLGVSQTPKRVESMREVVGAFRNITMPCAGLWELLEATVFEEDSYPYDGWLLHMAIGDLLNLAGVPSSPRDIQTSTLRLDFVRPTVDTKWAWKPQAGDSVGQWLKKIWETLAPNWYMGFYPTTTVMPSGSTSSALGTWGFQFRSPLTMSSAPAAYVWLASEGHTAATFAPSEGERIPAFAFSEETFPADASRITVWGYDPATKTLLRGFWSDPTLEDPTMAPSSRPAGWTGYVLPYVATLPRLRTAASVAAARDALAAELGVEQKIAEWQCPLLFKADTSMVWKGDVVEVRPATTTLPGGNPVGGRYRIKSFSLSWKRDAKGRRLVSYVGERIANIGSSPE